MNTKCADFVEETLLENIQKDGDSYVYLLEPKTGIPCHSAPSLCQPKFCVNQLQCSESSRPLRFGSSRLFDDLHASVYQ